MKYRNSFIHTAILIGASLFLVFPSAVPAQSGVAVDQAVITAWAELGVKQSPRYVALKVSDDSKSIIVEKTFDSSTSYDDFIGTFPNNDCRYYFVDFRYTDDSGSERSERILIRWAPEGVSASKKAALSVRFSTLQSQLTGVDVQLTADDVEDVSKASILKELHRRSLLRH